MRGVDDEEPTDIPKSNDPIARDETPNESGPDESGPNESVADDAHSQSPGDLNWDIPEWTAIPLGVIAMGAVVWAFGADRTLLVLLPFAALVSVIAIIDFRELRVPNAILSRAALAAFPLLDIAATSSWPDVSLSRACLGALIMGVVYLIMGMVYPAGMGFGDIKFAPFVGAQLALFGWVPFVRGFIMAFWLLGPIAIVLLLTRRARLKTGLPFAPFMGAGALVALVLHGRGIG